MDQQGIESTLKEVNLREEYRTGETNLIEDFYRPCLRHATRYDRAVGYFRSSVFLLIIPELINFSKQGGKIRLICSPSITVEDSEAIANGYNSKDENIPISLLEDIDVLFNNPKTKVNTELLATLISLKILEIKIAFRPVDHGMYHEKIGIFYDKNDESISFKGSTNETWAGWHERGNYESFDAFCTWEQGREANRVKRAQLYFEKLWNGKIEALEIVDFPDVCQERLAAIAKNDLDDIDTDEMTNFHNMQKVHNNKKEQKREPYPHQKAAIQAWNKQGRHGIFEHATGSGKTFTALTAMKEHLGENNVVLVLVPDRLLHRQWADEISDEIEGVSILKAGDGHSLWRKNKRLRNFSSPGTGLGKRVILATMQTARIEEFTQAIFGGDHLMVVADEVHEIGSSENSKALVIVAGAKLGLSATPRRYGDPIGTQRIFDYFGEIIDPPYTLEDAISQGRLVEYEYHPEPIRLTAEESEDWETATREISREYARSKRDDKGKPIPSKRLQNMLIQRSRIAKKASAKVPYAVNTIKDYYQEGESWLIYCEDQYQLKDILESLKVAGYKPLEYHTSMKGSPDATLDWFRNFGGILVSIRCLDQGIDIPKISHAIILASSQNPRQFIQRRGRVLRTYKNHDKNEYKYKAVIFDAVVVPLCLELEPGQLSLLKSELQRSIQFSNTAMNRAGANQLISIAIELGIDPNEVGLIDTNGIEEELNNDD